MPCLNLGALCVCCKALPLHKLSITEKVVQAVQSMLLPQEGSLSIHTSLPASGDGASPVMAVVRLLAEIRTRSEPQCILCSDIAQTKQECVIVQKCYEPIWDIYCECL